MYQRMLAQTLQGNGGGPQYPAQATGNALAQMLQMYSLKTMGEKQDATALAKETAGNQALADVVAPPEYRASGQNAVEASAPMSYQPPDALTLGGVPQPRAPQQTTLDAGLPDYTNANADKNAQLVAMLTQGVGKDEIGKQALTKLGLGPTPDPKDRYMNVPGVGMVDLKAEGGPRPVVRERLKGNQGDVFLDQTDTGLAPAYSIPDTKSPDREAQDIRIAGAGASRTSLTVNGTAGEDARDRAAGTMVSEFIDSGGYADAEKNLKQLRAVSATLKSGANVTGPVWGSMPDVIGTTFNPQAVDTREQVEEVVQRNLRSLLGAQFTAQEGERLIARAYNPKLPEATNKDRVDRLIGAMEKAYASKKAAAEYLNKNRTMRGYVGPRIWSLGDIEAAAGLDAKPPPVGSQPPPVPDNVRNAAAAELARRRAEGGN